MPLRTNDYLGKVVTLVPRRASVDSASVLGRAIAYPWETPSKLPDATDGKAYRKTRLCPPARQHGSRQA